MKARAMSLKAGLVPPGRTPLTRLIIGGGVFVVVLLTVGLFAAHPLSLLLDKVLLTRVASAPATRIGWDGVALQFNAPAGAQGLDLEGPGPAFRAAATASVDAQGRLVISANGESFVVGPRAGDLPADGSPAGTVPAYAAEPGDVGAVTIERSVLSRPVFELNFMTGRSPTWRRDVYDRLSLKKRSGQRLEMLWRFEQGFYPGDGWTAHGGTHDGVTGLLQVQILPPPPAAGR
jgi:hypothetical protein